MLYGFFQNFVNEINVPLEIHTVIQFRHESRNRISGTHSKFTSFDVVDSISSTVFIFLLASILGGRIFSQLSNGN